MSKKNTANRTERTYSKAEYEHFCFSQEPFSGFVEGIGYTCTEVVVTARPLNRYGTEFMFDINMIGYTFDLSEMWKKPVTLSQLEKNKENADKQSDRSEYAQIPQIDKAAYRDDGWKYVQNPLAFVNNVATELFNSLIDIINGPIGASQIMYYEGMGAWWDNEVAAAKGMWDGVKDTYDYHTQASAGKQWDDFRKDISSIESWEKNTALGAGLFSGAYGIASKAGIIGRGTGMLTEIPAGAITKAPVVPKSTNMFPIIREGHGLFGKKGLVMKNYKIEMMYRHGDGGSIFSVREGVINSGNFKNLNNGNLFRIELHSHDSVSRLHYHFRWFINGEIKGSTQARSITLIRRK